MYLLHIATMARSCRPAEVNKSTVMPNLARLENFNEYGNWQMRCEYSTA